MHAFAMLLAIAWPLEPTASAASPPVVQESEAADPSVDPADDLETEPRSGETPSETPAPTAAEEDGPYAWGVSAEAQAGIGGARRRVGPVAEAGTGEVRYPVATPLAEVALRLGGVPRAARALELFGTASLRSAFASRVEIVSPTGTPRRPRARSLEGLVAFGLVGWPRALQHQLGIGGELGYGLYPFLVESKIGIPSFLVHGPRFDLRLDAELLGERLLLTLRPFAGLAITDRALRDARFGERGPQFGVRAQIAVRVYGFLHVYANYNERHALLPYGEGGVFDDFDRGGVAGLMIRGTRDPGRARH
jgi:hypothetical protein